MPHLIFVLGTLKQGCRNFHVNRGRRVGGDVVTIAPYPLYGIGPRHLPWLLDRPGQGQPVVGQLFEVDDDTLAAMDTPTGRYPLPAGRRCAAAGICVRPGRPAARQREYMQRETWSWRHQTNGCLWARVTLGAEGRVQGGAAMMSDPACDAGRSVEPR